MVNPLNFKLVSSRELVSLREVMVHPVDGPLNFGSSNKIIRMKRDKIIYWIATGLVAAGMLASGAMYLSRNPELMANFQTLSLPVYLVTLLGVAKLAGAIVLVAPVWSKLKEWAYAGFAFVFVGATWTHAATGTPSMVAPLLFLAILGISYFFRLRIHKG
jgi:uncharacterized membrane protein YphA (DoxX/SURF4 family)